MGVLCFLHHIIFFCINRHLKRNHIKCNLLEFIDSELISKIESVGLGKLGNNGNRLKIRISKHIDVGKPTLTKIFRKIYTNHFVILYTIPKSQVRNFYPELYNMMQTHRLKNMP